MPASSAALAAGSMVAALLALPGTARAEDITPPDVLVKSVTLEVVDIVRNDRDIQAGDRRKVIALVETKVVPHFNFAAMTASAAGNHWGKATQEQKTRLTEEFRTLMVRTYASSIAAYKDQKFDFRPLRARPADTDVTINVRVLQAGAAAVKIDYEMEKTARGWKVWDVRVADISLTANYRTEFANVVRDSGIDGLIRTLEAKNRSTERPAAAIAAEKKNDPPRR
ncbi:MAG TPA: ABC transporter substrate-binding protein [Burkholderiales bacterium]|nr:ABC transporter substrate-binding protein [Burkholderiales bacterium]